MSLHALLWSLWIAHASRPVSRGFVSLLFALIRGKRLRSPAQEGIRRVGAPSMRRPSRAAKPTLALTHPSNLRETGVVTLGTRGSGRQRGRHRSGSAVSGIKGGAVPEQRREDAGHPAGEGHGGDVLAATRRDVQGPGVEGLRLRRPAPKDGEGDLNQEPAHAGRPGLGDVAAVLRLPRTELARHQAEGGFDLVRVAEALGVIEGGDEGGGGHGPDAGDGAQALNT